MFVIPVFIAVIAEFIQITLRKNLHKKAFRALLNKLKPCHGLFSSLSQEELSAQFQAMVKERQMSWLHFAWALLHFEATRPFIFDITEHTGGESFA